MTICRSEMVAGEGTLPHPLPPAGGACLGPASAQNLSPPAGEFQVGHAPGMTETMRGIVYLKLGWGRAGALVAHTRWRHA